jgi:hypothetical protein
VAAVAASVVVVHLADGKVANYKMTSEEGRIKESYLFMIIK